MILKTLTGSYEHLNVWLGKSLEFLCDSGRRTPTHFRREVLLLIFCLPCIYIYWLGRSLSSFGAFAQACDLSFGDLSSVKVD